MMFAIGTVFGASAKDNYSHDPSILPQAAITTISDNFKAEISVIKIDKDFGRVSDYEVILTDGTEIKFDRNGNWEDVECSNNKSVPASFIPKVISEFVSNNQPNTHIVGIEKGHSGYEIALSNGIEAKFNKNGAFQRYD